jgi:hypothetical protein
LCICVCACRHEDCLTVWREGILLSDFIEQLECGVVVVEHSDTFHLRGQLACKPTRPNIIQPTQCIRMFHTYERTIRYCSTHATRASLQKHVRTKSYYWKERCKYLQIDFSLLVEEAWVDCKLIKCAMRHKLHICRRRDV